MTEELRKLAQAIYDKKGVNIIALDVRGLSSITDYLLIAEGSVERHVKALGDILVEELKKSGNGPQHVEGDESSNWMVIDTGEILIHLFVPFTRQKYALEELWHEGKIVDLKLKVSHEE